MKLKEMVSKFKYEDEYRIMCKCGREGNLEVCGDYAVESVEIKHDIKHDIAVITINKSLEEIYAHRAIKDISGVLTYDKHLNGDYRSYFYMCIEMLKEVGTND